MKSLLSLCALALLLTASAFAAAPPTSDRITGLIELLDDDDYFVRQQADDQLRAMGANILPRLLNERARTSSLEVKHRIDRMAEKWQRAELSRTTANHQ